MRRWIGWSGLAALVVIQCVIVYAPETPGVPLFPHADKVVHGLLFAAPAAWTTAYRLRPRQVLLLLAVHAPASELVQHLWLSHRYGNAWDALADLVGLCLGAGVGEVVRRVARRW